MIRLITTVMIASALAMQPASGPASRPAATSPDIVSERLDDPIAELKLSSAPLPEVLKRLGDAAGVAITLDPEVAEHLPYGLSTKLSNLSVQNATLRETLPKILVPLGLRHRVVGMEIRIVCTPALARMDGNAKWDELKLLASLSTQPYSAEEFKKLNFNSRISAKVQWRSVLSEQMEEAGRGTMAQVLESATNALGWTWFPDDDKIVLLTKQAAIARALSEKMSKDYIQRHLGEILFEFGREADVHIYFQPGTFKKLPPHIVDNYSLRCENWSIRQALEFICGDTGLAYSIQVDGIHIGVAEDIAKMPNAAAAADDPYVGKVSVPMPGGGEFEFLFRESELSPDVLALRRKALKDFEQAVRKPAATAPASAPSR